MSEDKTEIAILKKKKIDAAHQFWGGDVEKGQEPGLLYALKIS